jgi:hypothetical protein
MFLCLHQCIILISTLSESGITHAWAAWCLPDQSTTPTHPPFLVPCGVANSLQDFPASVAKKFGR